MENNKQGSVINRKQGNTAQLTKGRAEFIQQIHPEHLCVPDTVPAPKDREVLDQLTA